MAITIDTLWTFALSAYAGPGVEAACLEAQDRYGADISLMLALLWADRAGLTIDEATWWQLRATSRHWQESVLTPLRAARSAAKGGVGYEDLKAQELAEEKKAMSALCDLMADAQPGKGKLLQRYAETLNLPDDLLAPLTGA